MADFLGPVKTDQINKTVPLEDPQAKREDKERQKNELISKRTAPTIAKEIGLGDVLKDIAEKITQPINPAAPEISGRPQLIQNKHLDKVLERDTSKTAPMTAGQYTPEATKTVQGPFFDAKAQELQRQKDDGTAKLDDIVIRPSDMRSPINEKEMYVDAKGNDLRYESDYPNGVPMPEEKQNTSRVQIRSTHEARQKAADNSINPYTESTNEEGKKTVLFDPEKVPSDGYIMQPSSDPIETAQGLSSILNMGGILRKNIADAGKQMVFWLDKDTAVDAEEINDLFEEWKAAVEDRWQNPDIVRQYSNDAVPVNIEWRIGDKVVGSNMTREEMLAELEEQSTTQPGQLEDGTPVTIYQLEDGTMFVPNNLSMTISKSDVDTGIYNQMPNIVTDDGVTVSYNNMMNIARGQIKPEQGNPGFLNIGKVDTEELWNEDGSMNLPHQDPRTGRWNLGWVGDVVPNAIDWVGGSVPYFFLPTMATKIAADTAIAATGVDPSTYDPATNTYANPGKRSLAEYLINLATPGITGLIEHYVGKTGADTLMEKGVNKYLIPGLSKVLGHTIGYVPGRIAKTGFGTVAEGLEEMVTGPMQEINTYRLNNAYADPVYDQYGNIMYDQYGQEIRNPDQPFIHRAGNFARDEAENFAQGAVAGGVVHAGHNLGDYLKNDVGAAIKNRVEDKKDTEPSPADNPYISPEQWTSIKNYEEQNNG